MSDWRSGSPASPRFDVTAKPRTLWFRPLAAIMAGTAVALAATAALGQPLPVVPALDLDRYVGRWHEIARYPNRFERACAREVTATYARNADGTIAVVNACVTDTGAVQRAEGQARVVAPAKLKVRFAPAWLGFLPFVWGDYWVIDLAPDYSYSVVGDPSREYLWILARAPEMDEATYRRITGRLPALGYDPARLLRNPAPPPVSGAVDGSGRFAVAERHDAVAHGTQQRVRTLRVDDHP